MGVVLNASGDYLRCYGTDLDSPSTLTIIMVVKWTALSVNNSYVLNVNNGSTQHQVRFRMGSGANKAKLEMWFSSSAGVYSYTSWFNDTFSTGTWYYIACTWAGGSNYPNLYYKPAGGAWVAATADYTEGSGSVSMSLGGLYWQLGQSAPPGASYLDGQIDFAALVFDVLTETECKAACNNPQFLHNFGSNLKVLTFPGIHGASTFPNLCRANPAISANGLTLDTRSPFLGPIFGCDWPGGVVAAAGQLFDETGRAVSAAGSVMATDVLLTAEAGRAVSAAGSVMATDVAAAVETGKSVSAGGSVADSDAHVMAEVGRAVSAAGTVAATDLLGWLEPVAVSAAGSVSAADLQVMPEAAAVAAAGSVSGADVQVMVETGRIITAAGTVSVSDVMQMIETGRIVTAAGTVAAFDALVGYAVAAIAFRVLRQGNK